MTTTIAPQRPWKTLHAFGLPEGSVRAVLALAIFATLWVVLARHPDREVPDYLRDLMFIILGHYFASRRKSSVEPTGPAPLFLPRGSIRVILFAGFGLVAYILYAKGSFREPLRSPGAMTLMLVAGFLLGVVAAKLGECWADRGHRAPRWAEDLRAVVAIVAALALIVMIWNRFDPILIPRRPEVFDRWNVRLGEYGPEHVLGAIVGFYFGSRS